MLKEKRSFFERLTGSFSPETEYLEVNSFQDTDSQSKNNYSPVQQQEEDEEDSEDGQLAVDVFQNENEIIVQAIVAGIRPDELDVSVDKNQVSIKGKRTRNKQSGAENALFHELYWGRFGRVISMPGEVDADSSEAVIKNGILTLKIPFVKKSKTQKIRVREE